MENNIFMYRGKGDSRCHVDVIRYYTSIILFSFALRKSAEKSVESELFQTRAVLMFR